MVGCTLFKLCHCKCAKAYLLEILGMSRLWHDLMAHGPIPRDLHCAPSRHSVTGFIHVQKARSLWERLHFVDCQWVPLKYLKYFLNGLRWDSPPQRIWNSHNYYFTSFTTVLVKFQIKIRFSIELHGNSKLSMTSCPSSSGFRSFPSWMWRKGIVLYLWKSLITVWLM